MRSIISLFIFTILVSSNCLKAEVQAYESTDNAGLNKRERIDSVEKYLSDLAASLKKMEAKLDENATKVKSIEEVLKAMKDAEAKKMAPKLGEQKVADPKDKTEMDKIKADILAMKNQDIEKLKINLEELSDTVKVIQATIRNQNK